MKNFLAASAALVLCGCSTLKLDYSVIDGKTLSPKDETQDEFETLMARIGEDRANLARFGAAYNKVEGSFGLAVLATAAYGAFNTTYGGDNLKDAAFAAASITSLRSYSTPGKRRDAYLKAALGLKCIHESAQPFLRGNLNAFTYDSTTTFNSLKSAGASFTPSSNARGIANALINLGAPGVRMSAEDQYAQLAGYRLVAALKTEDEIFEQRFSIVSSEYLEVIGELMQSTKFSTADYEAEVSNLKKSIEKLVRNEQAGQAAEASANFKGFAGSDVADVASRYADAKVAVEACHVEQ